MPILTEVTQLCGRFLRYYVPEPPELLHPQLPRATNCVALQRVYTHIYNSG